MAKRYTHPDFSGVALYIAGYPKEWEPWTALVVDEDGNEQEEDTGEGEWIELGPGNGRAIVTMVGDDGRHTVEESDLVPLEPGAYCTECGQVGCCANVAADDD